MVTKFDFKPKLLAIELIMFAIVQALALFVGYTFFKKGIIEQMTVTEALPSFFIAFAIAIVMMVAIMYFLKTPKTFAVFFGFMIFIGTNIVFSAFFPDLIAIPLAIAVVAIRFWKPSLVTHNLAMFLTIAGVSAQLGLMIPVLAVIIILIGLSIYDYIAVFKTRTMVKMFKQMMQRGAPFAIVVPESPQQFNAQIHKVSKEKLEQMKKSAKGKSRFLMLGTGDLAFPAVFAVSALSQGINISLVIIAGALVGIVINHYYLTKKFRAIPALPAIAACSIIAYALAQLPNWI